MAKKTPSKPQEFNDTQDVIDAIRKKFGQESISIAEGPIIRVPSISTGSMTLDNALGVWGLPKGRVVEVYGPESGGKTTLSLSIVNQLQKSGGTAAFIDAEHALDLQWASNIGVNINKLIVSQPNSAEQALSIVETLAVSGKIDLIVIDSVAGLVPQCEIDGEIGDNHIGAHARLMSQALRKLVAIAKKSNCVILFINQIRMKIGVMYGSPETTPGGRALKFYSSVRLDVRRKTTIKKGDEQVGINLIIKVVKNKVAPPFREAECALYFGKNGYPYGIDYASSVIDLADKLDVVKKTGSWYSFEDEKIANGYIDACTAVRDNSSLMDRISSKIKEIVDVELGVAAAVVDNSAGESSFDEDDDEQES